MGSLMAGWDSQVLNDPDTLRAERNRSLTKEEIQSFWKLKKKVEEEEDYGEVYTKQYSTSAPSSYMDFYFKNSTAAGRKLQTAKSGSPKSPRSPKVDPLHELGEEMQAQPDAVHERDYKLGDWWTRSTWAFLNEPPQERNDESEHKYKPQFDVARMATAGHA